MLFWRKSAQKKEVGWRRRRGPEGGSSLVWVSLTLRLNGPRHQVVVWVIGYEAAAQMINCSHQYHHGRAGGCSRTIDNKDVKGRFVISHRRRNIGNQKKRQIKWHRTLTPRGELWTDMMVAKRENCKTTIESLDHHMVDQRIVTRRWWSGDQTYSRQSPALIRFSHRRRYSLHHLPTTPSAP